MDGKYLRGNAESPVLATVSFLPAPTSVPEKAAKQPVGGRPFSDSNVGSADISQPRVHYFALRLMLFVLRFVFLQGNTLTPYIKSFHSPIHWLLRTMHEPRLLGFHVPKT